MNTAQKEAEQTQLLPALQPSLQPMREAPVLSSVVQLVDSSNLAPQVDQRQHCNGYSGQCPVHYLHGDLVKVALLAFYIRVDDVTHKGIGKEKYGEGHCGEDRAFPGREETQRYVLNLSGG